MMYRTLCYSFLIVCTALNIQAQEKSDKWDVSEPQGDWNWKEVEFTTNEGTWMNLDVSPDGKTIAFDLLGDIYVMPVEGGKAKAIRSGLAWEVQPRFSPDGKKILFTSDAGGGDNCWVMELDGSNAKAITSEDFRLLNNGIWTPDGQYIIARKHFTSGRSLGAGEMWLYHISGGEGSQLTKRKNDQQDVNEPSISPDGRYLYYSEDMYPGGYFQYNKDPNTQIYVIKRYDRELGETNTVLSGPGGAFRPEVSPDGKTLAFLKRIRAKTVLCLFDLETGMEEVLFEKLDKDQQEAWAVFGVYPGFDWTPDGKHIIIQGEGKIWRVDVADKEGTEIPFEATVKTRVAETIHFKNDAYTEKFESKVIRHAVTSPDGKYLVFNAVGHLWKMDLPKGKPERLTEANEFEFEPSFAPDGTSIVYVTWDDEAMGKIKQLDLNSGLIKILIDKPGIYRTPSYSPHGKDLVYRKDGGNGHQGFVHCQEPGIYTLKIADLTTNLVTPQGEYPVFNKKGDRIFYQTGGYLFGSLTKSFESVDLNGKEKKEHFVGKYTQRYVISPDNEWVAWSELYKVYIAPYPKTGQKVGMTSKTKAVPVAQVGRDAGINIHWSPDSKNLHWTLGNEYYSNSLEDRFKFLNAELDSLPPMDSIGLKVVLDLEMDRPKGTIALTNARIITMDGDKVIEGGTVLIDGNEITKIGEVVKIPKRATIIDCSGKTVMPGLIDVHAHSGNFRNGLSPQKQWEYYAKLAYGVTTSHDPSANSEMVFAQSELIKAGKMVGPRLFSTGTILYGADGDFKAVVNSLEDARSAIRRTKAFGAFSVKSYNQPRRNQRQMVIQAARELGILVVPEGGSFFYHNLSMVADGHTGVEHNLPVAPLYKDVLNFWSATTAHNTPTLVVNYGSVNGEYYWYEKTK
jgi:Tol biopolymer transport system component